MYEEIFAYDNRFIRNRHNYWICLNKRSTQEFHIPDREKCHKGIRKIHTMKKKITFLEG